MTFESFIYTVLLMLCLLALMQGSRILFGGIRFYRYVDRRVAEAGSLKEPSGAFKYQPSVVVILPCCGVDEKLGQTVQALARQKYAGYEIIFTFESSGDPAYIAIGDWTRDWDSLRHRRVVAGPADQRSQKIHNLLAAVKETPADRDVLVFLDSDAVPGEDWLGHIVAALKDETVAVATGYRWYRATGGIAAGVRCVWNAGTMTMLANEKINFCWGGATAVRKEMFEFMQIARFWDRALSDDYQMTNAVRKAGLNIRFVPQALVMSSDRTTLADFWAFARRQLIITRIYGPRAWWYGLILTGSLVISGTALAIIFVACMLGWRDDPAMMLASLFGLVIIVSSAAGNAILRQMALRKVLHPPNLTWRDFCWDVGGSVAFAGWLHLHLIVASMMSRRVVWRNIEYELVSPQETRVLRRLPVVDG